MKKQKRRLKKVNNMKIKERLNFSSIITVSISSISALLAIITVVFMVGRYNDTLTYSAFPQGDIGKAMTALADMRSATRTIIGYDNQEVIDEMLIVHDQKKH